MNTATTMGLALLVFGVALALTAGAADSVAVLALGLAGATVLLYMGVGLYSRGTSGEDRLHEVDDPVERSRYVESTSAYVAGAAAAVALLGFGAASVTGAGALAQVVFGGVFLYSVYTFVVLRRGEAASGEAHPAGEGEVDASPDDAS